MGSVYPTSVKVFPVFTDEVDLVSAYIANSYSDEISAIEGAIGTNPQGNQINLVTRLAVCLGTDGAIQRGSAFPTNPKDGQLFVRNDEPALYFYAASTSTWQSPSVLSNVVFSHFAHTGDESALAAGGVTSTATTLTYAGAGVYQYDWLAGTESEKTLRRTQLKKIAGMTTLTLRAQIWRNSGSDGSKASIGLLVNTGASQVYATAVGSVNQSTPEWVSVSVSVSGLSNGTFYTTEIRLNDLSGAARAYLGSFLGVIS